MAVSKPPKHGTPRPHETGPGSYGTLDGEALWCAICKRYVSIAPVTGAVWFWIRHPPRRHRASLEA